MSTYPLHLTVRSIGAWLCRRAERRTQLLTAEELYHAPDPTLSDIGLSRAGVLRLRCGPLAL